VDDAELKKIQVLSLGRVSSAGRYSKARPRRSTTPAFRFVGDMIIRPIFIAIWAKT
jgi:hypothetical protein